MKEPITLISDILKKKKKKKSSSTISYISSANFEQWRKKIKTQAKNLKIRERNFQMSEIPLQSIFSHWITPGQYHHKKKALVFMRFFANLLL